MLVFIGLIFRSVNSARPLPYKRAGLMVLYFTKLSQQGRFSVYRNENAENWLETYKEAFDIVVLVKY